MAPSGGDITTCASSATPTRSVSWKLPPAAREVRQVVSEHHQADNCHHHANHEHQHHHLKWIDIRINLNVKIKKMFEPNGTFCVPSGKLFFILFIFQKKKILNKNEFENLKVKKTKLYHALKKGKNKNSSTYYCTCIITKKKYTV